MTSTVGTRQTERPSGFTLVELMVVIALIAVLASSIVVVVRGIRARALKSTTKAMLGKIQVAAEKYKQKYRRSPDATRRVTMYHATVWNNMTAEQRLFAMLFEASDQYRQQEIREDCVYRPDGEALRENGNPTTVDDEMILVPVLVDAYGSQIGFRCAAKSYLIYSLGPDGVTAGNDMVDNDGDTIVDEEEGEPHSVPAGKPDEGNWPTGQPQHKQEGYKFGGKVGDDIQP